MIEVAWTAIPVLILVVIAIPSFKLLYYSDVVEDTEMTVKAIGRQWYWSYEYPDHGNFTFDAFMIADEDIDQAAGQKRLLETDNRVVVPVETNIRLLTTASDVIHSWAIPSVRRQAGRRPRACERGLVPGRRARHLLRTMLRAMRGLSWLHADHRRSDVESRLRGLDQASSGRVCPSVAHRRRNALKT